MTRMKLFNMCDILTNGHYKIQPQFANKQLLLYFVQLIVKNT